MRWLLNFLVKILGGFLASLGFFMTKQEPVSIVWVVVLLTIGLALLFAPAINKK